MIHPQNEKATGQGGSPSVAGGQAKTTKQNKTRYSGTHHINKVLREIRSAELWLKSTSGETQLTTLIKVLQHFGPRGFSTYEGQAAGYLRIATRIKELKETWEIQSLREDVIGPDGLWHKGVARYVLIGKRQQPAPVQADLGLEVPA